jgi:hypothetical protein
MVGGLEVVIANMTIQAFMLIERIYEDQFIGKVLKPVTNFSGIAEK